MTLFSQVQHTKKECPIPHKNLMKISYYLQYMGKKYGVVIINSLST